MKRVKIVLTAVLLAFTLISCDDLLNKILSGSELDAPADPMPANGATDVLLQKPNDTVTLSWSAPDSEETVKYDVYFGETLPNDPVASDRSTSIWTTGTLLPGTTYRWRVVAKTSEDSVESPIWSFTTEVEPVVLELLAYNSDDNYQGQNFSRIVTEFETANTDVDIQYESYTGAAYYTEVQSRLAANDVPDMAYMEAEGFKSGPWRSSGNYWDHRPHLDSAYYNLSMIWDMDDAVGIQNYYVPEGFPVVSSVLYVNQTLLTSLGLTMPSSYADLVAMVETATENGVDVITINGADGWAWNSCILSQVVARLAGIPNWVPQAVYSSNRFTDQVFVDALAFIRQMVTDGVIPAGALVRNYGANLDRYNNNQALMMIQGDWISPAIAENRQAGTQVISFPTIPGQQAAMAGSISNILSPGYGLSARGGTDTVKRAAGFKFLRFYNSLSEATKRFRDGNISFPILVDFVMPNDLKPVTRRTAEMVLSAPIGTAIIDTHLTGDPNDVLNAGLLALVAGTKTPSEVAAEVETALDR